MLAAAAVVATQILLISLTTRSELTPSSLAAYCAALMVPVAVAAALVSVRQARTRAREEAAAAARLSLVGRVERSEGTLARTQERLHELRATLGSLKLSHQVLIDHRAALSRATRWRLQRLHTAELDRVERLLSPTKTPDPITVVDVIDVLAPLVDAMALRGCRVHVRGTGPFFACGRGDDLTEIVHVLLDNAARHAAARDVVVEVASGGGWVRLRVQDSGPGVPRALTPVVFERGSRSVQSQGEGIGLHVARRLAKELGGDLWLEPTQDGGGAVFVLGIPEATGHEPCLAAAV